MKRFASGIGSVLALTFVLAAAGCGSDESGPAGGSCTFAGICADYTGSLYKGTADVAKKACVAASGTYSSSACSSSKRVGTCTIDAGEAAETKQSYYEPEFDAAGAEAACTHLSGTWKAD